MTSRFPRISRIRAVIEGVNDRNHEYWVADLQNDRLLVYSDPEGDSYRTARELHRGESLAPGLLPDCRISVDIFLP